MNSFLKAPTGFFTAHLLLPRGAFQAVDPFFELFSELEKELVAW
jgi:hypothetical protein